MNITIFGAGVQGTVYGVRLAMAGHSVTLIATPHRADDLRRVGATIRHAETTQTATAQVRVLEELPPEASAHLCLVTVRREQLTGALKSLARATRIERFVFLVNHAAGSEEIFNAVGRHRTVLAFPGVAGRYAADAIVYIDIPEQHTIVDCSAKEISDLFQTAGFAVNRVRDVDAWLRHHAVLICAMAGALYENDCNAARLAGNGAAMRRLILAIRQGWRQLDRTGEASAPQPLKFILCQVPLWLSSRYWSRLLSSARGELYFAAHTRHAPDEMAALAIDVRTFTGAMESPELHRLLASVDRWKQAIGIAATTP